MSQDAVIALIAVCATLFLAALGAVWTLGHRLGSQDAEIASVKDDVESIKEETRWQSRALMRLFSGSKHDSTPPTRPRGKLLTLDDPMDPEKQP